MVLVKVVAQVNPTVIPERTTAEVVRPWHELDYAQLEADSDRILADALTPQAVVLLTRVATAPGDRPRPSPPVSVSWTVSAPPAPDIRATQRSPPRSAKDPSREHISPVYEVRKGVM